MDAEEQATLLPLPVSATPSRRQRRFELWCRACWPDCLWISALAMLFLLLGIVLVILLILLLGFVSIKIFNIDTSNNHGLDYFFFCSFIGGTALTILIGGVAIVVATGLLLYLVIVKAYYGIKYCCDYEPTNTVWAFWQYRLKPEISGCKKWVANFQLNCVI